MVSRLRSPDPQDILHIPRATSEMHFLYTALDPVALNCSMFLEVYAPISLEAPWKQDCRLLISERPKEPSVMGYLRTHYELST